MCSSVKKNYLSGSAPSSEHRFEFSSWWYDVLNDLITLIWLYQIKKILFGCFLSLGSCIQNPLRSEIRGGTCPLTLNGHDVSACKYSRNHSTAIVFIVCVFDFIRRRLDYQDFLCRLTSWKGELVMYTSLNGSRFSHYFIFIPLSDNRDSQIYK